MPVGGLHFKKAMASIEIERLDVIAEVVSVFIRDPSDIPRQVVATGLAKPISLKVEHHLLAGASEGPVELVPLRRIVPLGQPAQRCGVDRPDQS